MLFKKQQTLKSSLLALACTFPLLSFATTEILALEYPEINSESAIVINAETGKVLYEKTPDYSMAPSSMATIMTAYLTFEEIQYGNLSWDTQVPITANHVALAEQLGLSVTHSTGTASVESLVKLIFLRADPVAALALAELIAGSEEDFVSRMNKTSNRLSMDTVYTDCSGNLPHDLTVRGQARLIQAFLEQFPEMSDMSKLTYTTYQGAVYDNQIEFLHTSSAYYDDAVTGLAVGTNDYADTSLTLTAEKNGVELITVLFHSDNIWTAYSDAATLSAYGFDAFANDPYHFHDTVAYPTLDIVYWHMRELGVNLQAVNGWVRPTELMTFGEFAITLTTALEQVGLIKNTVLYFATEIQDLADYPNKDVILRGIEIGLLPLQADGDFHPNDLLTMSNVDDFLSALIKSFDLGEPEELQPLIPEVEVEKPTVSYTSPYDENAYFLGQMYPVSNIVSSGAQGAPTPRSIQEYISRGYATQLVYEFLAKYNLI